MEHSKNTNDNIIMPDKPWKISSYLIMEKWQLIIISFTGIIYNVGMIAGPWFEGLLAQKLFDVLMKKQAMTDMIMLACIYVAVIFTVQLFRFFKRLYVRKYANHINRSMKQVIYQNLVQKSKNGLEAEGLGNVMTKSISDVDTCVEGIRKFTTEVFDTGVVMISYMVMLLYYDYKLALISFIFPPIAYIIAERLKKIVSKNAALYKESSGKLNLATMDRVSNAITYRVYGQEDNQNKLYEQCLEDYEKKAIHANIWETSMQPLYQIIAMISMIFILWFGARNVMQRGWTSWNIAAFTTFISCYTKLATKSSKAAKLINAVQKARVSWQRICPFLAFTDKKSQKTDIELHSFEIKQMGVKYDSYLFSNLCVKAEPGEIIGVTGPIACGKTAFGKAVLGEVPYDGDILINGKLLKLTDDGEYHRMVGYMGHDPELLSDTIENNILLGEHGDIGPYLRMVHMDEEVDNMPDGIHTRLGNNGVRLSGGQQARIALARTLFHRRPILVLDDPFSAVDKITENQIFDDLQQCLNNQVVFLISHRLDIFPKLSKIIWIDNGKAICEAHDVLMKKVPDYERLFRLQKEGVLDE